jgi:hypothetical protein
MGRNGALTGADAMAGDIDQIIAMTFIFEIYIIFSSWLQIFSWNALRIICSRERKQKSIGGP